MNEVTQLRIISRLIKTQEGKDFLEEVLIPQYNQNHAQLLNSIKENRDELIGYGICLYELIKVFNTCDEKLAKQSSIEGWS